MSPDRWERVKALFTEARQRPADERDAFLRSACAGDPDLGDEVRTLLEAGERSNPVDRIAEEWLGPLIRDLRERPETGSRVGPYEIVDEIGRGGMGVVYRARDPRLEREVAVKLLPAAVGSRAEAKARFLAEARAASALDHSNICTIYGADELEDGRLYIAMAIYRGQTLKQKLGRGPLSVEESVDLALQLAEGLRCAHEAGIVHRDVKPGNLILTSQGTLKILDFGVAKWNSGADLTEPGARVGTATYMAPEQVRGDPVDARTDLWALGAVLYEMLTGRRPFRGETEQAVLYSILHENPEPILPQPDLPEGLARLILQALEKDRERRPQSADDMLQHLERVRAADETPRIDVIPRIERLAETGDYATAYFLATQVEPHLPNDPTLSRLKPLISDRLIIITQPEGARVYLQRFAPDEQGRSPDRMFMGLTPIKGVRIARGEYRVAIEKEGFAPRECIASSALNRVESSFGVAPDIAIEVRLMEVEKVPDEMVFVPGSRYQLVGAGAPTMAEVVLEDYLIDRYAISNEQFRAFIQAGGYATKRYWKHPFTKEDRVLSWEEAIRHFTDRTGLPGPRRWIGQEFPSGTDRHPVTDITWYEAAAYAEFAGKRLPTVFEWEKAARDGAYTHFEGAVMPWGWVGAEQASSHHANFGGSGTEPVDSHPFGISPYGAYNMAGNVKEWCLNKIKFAAAAGPFTDRFASTGGSWEDPMYLFAQFGSFPGFFAAPSLGFRCAREPTGATSNPSAMFIDLDQQTPAYEPIVDEARFRSFLSHYRYDKQPLQAEMIQRSETPDWTREKVRLAVVDKDPVLAYLYLPKRTVRPYQCLVFVAGGNAFFEESVPEQTEKLLAPHIKSGRAVLAVVLKGMIERKWGAHRVLPATDSVQFREEMVLHATELSRALDDLEAREDIDAGKLAYVAFSRGAASRLPFAAVEERYKTIVLIGGGIDARLQPTLPEADCVNFAPFIRPPTLMVTGTYDEEHPYATRALPLYNLLREPKKLVLVEGGHLPSPEARVPVINQWLDETLGPVERE